MAVDFNLLVLPLLRARRAARAAAAIIAAALPICITACAAEQAPNSSMRLSPEACPGSVQRAPLTFPEWNKELAVTACTPANVELEYLPDAGDIAGTLLLTPSDGGKTTVLFAFQLAGTVSTSAEDVVRYIKHSEYAAIADPRSGVRGEILDLVDANSRRGAIVRWHESSDAKSAGGFNRAFGAFLSDGVVVFLDIETLTNAGLQETLGQVLSIKARRQR